MSLGYLARLGAACPPYAPPGTTGCTPVITGTMSYAATNPQPTGMATAVTSSAWFKPALYVAGGYVLYKLLFRKGATP